MVSTSKGVIRSQFETNTMRKKQSLSINFFPHDILELILEKLPVKTLLKFKPVSKQWKSTIESQHFQQRQLVRCQESKAPTMLLMSENENNDGKNIEALSTSDFKSSGLFEIPTDPLATTAFELCPSSCDGLICFHMSDYSSMVVNPTTRWHRSLPPPLHQQLILESRPNDGFTFPLLGFGKDKFNGTYKAVWLYNSSGLGLENVTTCEVFDFSATNSWRYITPSSPDRVFSFCDLVYVDGSLYCFVICEELKIIALDLHTETFHVISQVPFTKTVWGCMELYNLNNRLCVCEKDWPDLVLWSFDTGNETWNKMYSINLSIMFSGYGKEFCSPVIVPLAVLERDTKENKLLFSCCGSKTSMFLHDPQAKSYDLVFTCSDESIAYHVWYFSSLVSIL